MRTAEPMVERVALVAAGAACGALATLAYQHFLQRPRRVSAEEEPAWLKLAEEELSRSASPKIRHRATTAQIERSAPACKTCASALYLDAAANQMRCAACETAMARLGMLGTSDLGQNCFIDYFASRLPPDGFTFDALSDEVAWMVADDVLPDGSIVSQPRRIAYQADDPSLVYAYEGISAPLVPQPFSPLVAQLKAQVEDLCGLRFNSAHLNLYADGTEHVSWHTDEDVPLYGATPTIASVSFGVARDFVLRRMEGEPYTPSWIPVQPRELIRYTLGDGDVLVMRGSTQRHFEHALLKAGTPTAATSIGPRLNITFRQAAANM